MTSTCGLHVHVSKKGLGADYGEQEETIARVLYLVEAFWNEFLNFSRRTPQQLDRWAARYGRKDSPQEVLDHAKGDNIGRYTCVNLKNYATIEFRIFRGTLMDYEFTRPSYRWRSSYRNYGFQFVEDAQQEEIYNEDTEYYTELRNFATVQGYQAEDVDGWIEEGFELEEIENFLYCGQYL